MLDFWLGYDEYFVHMTRLIGVRGNAQESESRVQIEVPTIPSGSNAPTANIATIDPHMYTEEYSIPR